MKKEKKLNVQLGLAVVLCLFGAGIIIAAFILPPTGVIDASVLTAYGETLTFVGSLIGIDYHYKAKNSGLPDKEDS